VHAVSPGIKFVIVDFGGTGVTHAEIVACAAALTKQFQQHHALPPPNGWGINGTVRAAAGPTDVHPDEWVIGLLSHADQPGALGYHDATPHGRPFCKVFPLLDAADGVSWTQTASHEAIETADDPELGTILMSPDGTMWAEENSDACESSIVVIDGVALSDFVLPPWYGLGTGRCNWLGDLGPGQVGPGGYAQYYDPSQGWVSVQHAITPPRPYRVIAAGRRMRRIAKALFPVVEEGTG